MLLLWSAVVLLLIAVVAALVLLLMAVVAALVLLLLLLVLVLLLLVLLLLFCLSPLQLPPPLFPLQPLPPILPPLLQRQPSLLQLLSSPRWGNDPIRETRSAADL
jgi:hypothetical protein